MKVGSAKVNVFSNRYRADKSTIFGMRGFLGLTINSGRGATLKYVEAKKPTKMAAFSGRKVNISAFILHRKA